MTPSWHLLAADVLEGLRSLRSEIVRCVITSPPYWGLRDYGAGVASVWNGNPACEHQWGPELPPHHPGQVEQTKHPRANCGAGTFCARCGAWRGQLGLEPSLSLYVAHLVEVFDEVRRVLRPDGVLWLNLGDTHALGKPRSEEALRGGGYVNDPRPSRRRHKEPVSPRRSTNPPELKPLDLAGVPWRIAFALQEAGWYLRQCIIWRKPNPMPESVNGMRWEPHRIRTNSATFKRQGFMEPTTARGASGYSDCPRPAGWASRPDENRLTGRYRPHGDDLREAEGPDFVDYPGCPTCEPNGGLVLRRGSWRPTTGHEYIFLLSKSEDYYGDREAVREPHTMRPQARPSGHKRRRPGPLLPEHTWSGTARDEAGVDGDGAGRNPRTVWDFPTQAYPDAHFATFPEELPRRAILATTPEAGECSACGAPFARIVVREDAGAEPYDGKWSDAPDDAKAKRMVARTRAARAAGGKHENPFPGTETIGWRRTCGCTAPPVPSVVCDPFVGSGTTGQVALELGRRFIGIDRSLPYLFGMARNRIGASDPVEVTRRGGRLAPIAGPLFDAPPEE